MNKVITNMYGGPKDLPQIYADKINKGKRLPYFYLHGKAEDINEYDCCQGNIDAFYNALFAGLFLFELHCIDGFKRMGVMLTKFGFGRMEGLGMLLTDIESISSIVHDGTHQNKVMYEHHKDYLKENHIDVYNLLFDRDRYEYDQAHISSVGKRTGGLF